MRTHHPDLHPSAWRRGVSTPARIMMMAIALVLTIGLIIVLQPPKDENPETNTSLPPEEPKPQSPTPTQPVFPPDLEIVEPTEISAVTTSAEAADVHFKLIQELIPTLKSLSGIHDREQISTTVLDVANRLALLNRKIEASNFDKPGPASVTINSHDDIESILALWNTNPDVAETIDKMFRERNLLGDHNLAETLNRWINNVH